MSRNIVIDYMANHSGLASHKRMGNNGKTQRLDQLTRLSSQIKEGCGEDKTPAQIEYIWKSSKKNARAYNAARKTHHEKTGNNTGDKFVINPDHEKVLSILGSSHNNGLQLVKETGIHKQTFSGSNDIAFITTPNPDRKVLIAKQKFPCSSNETMAAKKIRLTSNHRVVYDINDDETASQDCEFSYASKPNMLTVLKEQNSNAAVQHEASNGIQQSNSKLDQVAKLPSIPISAEKAKENLISADHFLEYLNNKKIQQNTSTGDKITLPGASKNVSKGVEKKSLLPNKPLTNKKAAFKPRYLILDSNEQSTSQANLGTRNTAVIDNVGKQLAIPSHRASPCPKTRSENSLAYSEKYSQYANSYKRKQSTVGFALEAMNEQANVMKTIDASLQKIASAKVEKNAIMQKYYNEKLEIAKAKLAKGN